MDEKDRYDQGMKIRREVAGDTHVDRAEANRTPFNDAFQDFITRYAWGEVWARPGLERPTRSMITIAMLVALNREAELRMHFIAAANNGVSREEIKELLLHAALYCGLPAANSAYHLAAEVFAEQDAAAKE